MEISLTRVIWTLNTFENNFGINHEFKKYLMESGGLKFDQHFSFSNMEFYQLLSFKYFQYSVERYITNIVKGSLGQHQFFGLIASPVTTNGAKMQSGSVELEDILEESNEDHALMSMYVRMWILLLCRNAKEQSSKNKMSGMRI